jgi:hypothetical protein
MPLKPQDLLVCLELATRDEPLWTYAELSAATGLSASEAKGAVDRSLAAGLLSPALEDGQKPAPVRRALLDFLVHGARHVYFVEPGKLVRGVPTAWAAPPLNAEMLASAEPPPVWPSPRGSVRGQAIEPLYRSVPDAVEASPELYELLALVDALRIGRVRERALAAKFLEARLLGDASSKDPAQGDAA